MITEPTIGSTCSTRRLPCVSALSGRATTLMGGRLGSSTTERVRAASTRSTPSSPAAACTNAAGRKAPSLAALLVAVRAYRSAGNTCSSHWDTPLRKLSTITVSATAKLRLATTPATATVAACRSWRARPIARTLKTWSWGFRRLSITATTAGMALAPVGLLAILLTPVIGKKISVWDPRRIATVAFLGFALVLWLRAQFTTQTDLPHILVPTLMQGAAMAMFFIPLTTLTLAGIEPARIPSAAGLSNFTRITAGAMGTSISTTLWDNRAAMHHAHLTEGLVQGQGVFAQTLQGLQAAGMSQQQALGQINRLIDQQAFTRAADDIFLASAAIFLVLIGAIWLTRRPTPHKGAAPADAGGAH